MKNIIILSTTSELIQGFDLRMVISTVLILIIIGIVIDLVFEEIENLKRY